MLDKVHRKLARDRVTNPEAPEVYSIDADNLEQYLGKPFFPEDVTKKVRRPGMTIGLAWTPYGGDTLIIEAIANPGSRAFKLTGQMGDVMQESAGIAYSYVRSIAADYGVDTKYFEDHEIHIHIPAGATPKDGPSAGITMATTLLSLARGKPIKQRVAMTGELSLVGQVLPIGGLKEKTIAARRNGIKTVIIPEANEKDLDEIPDHIKKGIAFYPVSRLEEVLAIAFGEPRR